MANEAQIIDQPDALPGGATTGYVRQNTNAEAARNGEDSTAPFAASSTTVTIPTGGVVDVNGVLYSIISDATLTLAAADTDYYIHLVGTSPADLTPTLSTSSGTFDATKNARYNTSGERVLDWVFRRDASQVYIFKVTNKVSLYNNIAKVSDDSSQEITFNNTDNSGATLVTGEAYNIRVASNGNDGIRFIEKGSGDVTIELETSVGDGYFKGSLEVNDDLQINDNATIDGNLNYDGTLRPTTAPTISSQSVTSASPWTIPRGAYNISLEDGTLATSISVEIFVSGSWRVMAIETTTVTGGCHVFSDGSNVRVSGAGSGTGTAYYQKY